MLESLAASGHLSLIDLELAKTLLGTRQLLMQMSPLLFAIFLWLLPTDIFVLIFRKEKYPQTSFLYGMKAQNGEKLTGEDQVKELLQLVAVAILRALIEIARGTFDNYQSN